jgi:hypothetical protein
MPSARLSALAERIAQANRSVFEGSLEISKLCIGVNNTLAGLDARTIPETLTIGFSDGMLGHASSDDELAAVLSHELAHVTLQHQGFGETPPRMISDPQFLELRAESQNIQSQIVELAKNKADPEMFFALNSRFAVLLGRMNTRIDEVYGEENAHLNWMEQEADEAGAEFFVKAGFDKQAFINILWSTRRGDGEDKETCSVYLNAALRNPQSAKRPARGNKNHPATCWRVFHLLIDEWLVSHLVSQI